MFEAAESFLFEFFFGEGPYSGIVGLVVFEEVPEDAREFMGHGRDGFGSALAGFVSAETIAEVIFGAPEALRGQTQRIGRSAFHVPCFGGKDFSAGDAVVGR